MALPVPTVAPTSTPNMQAICRMDDVGLWVHALEFVPGTTYIVVGGGNTKVFDVATGTLVRVIYGVRLVRSVALYDNTRLVCADLDSVSVWNVLTGARIRTIGTWDVHVTSMAMSPDGTRVAVGKGDESFSVFDIVSGLLRREFVDDEWTSSNASTGPLMALVWLTSNIVIAGSGTSMLLKIWSMDQDTVEYVWLTAYATQGTVTSMCAIGDGTHVVVAGAASGAIGLWNMKLKHMVRSFVGHEIVVACVELSPNATRLASGDRDGIVKVWDVSGDCLMTRPHAAGSGFVAAVLSVAWSPDGYRVATAGMDRTVKIWETRHFRRVLHCMLRRRAGTGMAAVSTNVTEKQKRLFEFVYGLPYDAAIVGLPVLPDELFQVVCVFVD